MIFSAAQIAEAVQAPVPENVETCWPFIVAALDKYDIHDRAIEIAAAATVSVEVKRWWPIEEYRNADGSIPRWWFDYDGGWWWHGRGLIQLTHLYNYRAYAQDSGYDVVTRPDLLLTPEVSADSLAWFFSKRPGTIIQNAQDNAWWYVRAAVNGINEFGEPNGLHEFLGYVNALSALETNDMTADQYQAEIDRLVNQLGYITGDIADILKEQADTARRAIEAKGDKKKDREAALASLDQIGFALNTLRSYHP